MMLPAPVELVERARKEGTKAIFGEKGFRVVGYWFEDKLVVTNMMSVVNANGDLSGWGLVQNAE